MRVAVDFHDTLCSLNGPLVARFNELVGTDHTTEQIAGWDAWTYLPPMQRAMFFRLVDDLRNSRLPALPGSVNGLRSLIRDHNVVIVSATADPKGIRLWLEKNDIQDDVQIVSTIGGGSRSKYNLGFDVYIDDNPSMAPDPRLILFEQPWNRSVSNPKRAKTWEDVLEMIG